MDPRDAEIERLEAVLQLRIWVSAIIGVPIAVGAGLALVFFMTLAEPAPPDPEFPVAQIR